MTAGAASNLMNISGPEISCACTLYPERPPPPATPQFISSFASLRFCLAPRPQQSRVTVCIRPLSLSPGRWGHPLPWLQPGMGWGQAVPEGRVGNARAGCTFPGQSWSSPTPLSSVSAGSPQDGSHVSQDTCTHPHPLLGTEKLQFPWHHHLQGQGRSMGTTWGRSQHGPVPVTPQSVVPPPVSLPSTSSSVLVLAATDANCSMIYVWREQDIDASCHPSIGLTSLKYW